MRCYCCGKELGRRFVLVHYEQTADRVFVMSETCAVRADDPAVSQTVVIVAPKKKARK